MNFQKKKMFYGMRLVGLGLLIGAVLALTATLYESTIRANRGRTISPVEFRTTVRQKTSSLRDVMIFPPSWTSDGQSVQFVTGEISVPRDLTSEYEDFTFIADVPFAYPEAKSSDSTVMDFLSGVGRSGTPVSFTFAWWTASKFIVMISLIGSVALTAGVIPSFVAGLRLSWKAVTNERPEGCRATPDAVSVNEPLTVPTPEAGGAVVTEPTPAPPSPLPISEPEAGNIAESAHHDATFAQREFYPTAIPSEHDEPSK